MVSRCGKYSRLSRGELNRILETPEMLGELLMDHKRPVLNTGKAWKELHGLLAGGLVEFTGSLNPTLLGGQAIRTSKKGWEFGPALYKTPEDVIESYEVLKDISLEAVRKQYFPIDFWAVGLCPDPQDEYHQVVETLVAALAAITDFFKEAVDRQEGIVFWLDEPGFESQELLSEIAH